MSTWNDNHTVEIYSHGIVHCSVCVPKTMEQAQVCEEVNKMDPLPGAGWAISTDPHFRSGQTNPCDCPDTKGKQHWLMVC